MGNRANVIFTDGNGGNSVAVYLHWNGGPESVYGFLNELNRRKIRADQNYEAARFIQIVGEFFDQDKINGLSLGVCNGPKKITTCDLKKVRTDSSDNGFYVVNRTTPTMQVRRFKNHYAPQPDGRYKITLNEMSADAVKMEFEEAMKSDYIEDFKTTFAEITEGKEIEEN